MIRSQGTTNLIAPALFTQAALPALEADGGGATDATDSPHGTRGPDGR